MSNEARLFDVFISHSTKDSSTACAMKQHLQAQGIRCWKAPDDILPGESWPMAITRALSNCRVMVLIWSGNSMSSHEVSKELTLAMRNNLTVIPFRIENIAPVGEWDYHLVNTHWMDAHHGALPPHLDTLVGYLMGVLPDRAAYRDEQMKKPETSAPATMPPALPPAETAVSNKSGWPIGMLLSVGAVLLILIALMAGGFLLFQKMGKSSSLAISVSQAPKESPAIAQSEPSTPILQVQVPQSTPTPTPESDPIMFDVRSGYAAQLAKMIRESQIESLNAVNNEGAFTAKIAQLHTEADQEDKIAESSAMALQEAVQKDKAGVILAFAKRREEIQEAATDPKAAAKAAAALKAFQERVGTL